MNVKTYFGAGTGSVDNSVKTSSPACSRLALYSSRYSAGTYVMLNTNTHTHAQSHTHTQTPRHTQAFMSQTKPNNLAFSTFRTSITHLSGNYAPALSLNLHGNLPKIENRQSSTNWHQHIKIAPFSLNKRASFKSAHLHSGACFSQLRQI